jgi:ferredoxin
VTVIVDQDTCGGVSKCVVVAREVFNQRDGEDTVMLQQRRPRNGARRSASRPRRWPGPTIQLDES